jgi:hypothetical protein
MADLAVVASFDELFLFDVLGGEKNRTRTNMKFATFRNPTALAPSSLRAMSVPALRVACIHAMKNSMIPTARAFEAAWPEAQVLIYFISPRERLLLCLLSSNHLGNS